MHRQDAAKFVELYAAFTKTGIKILDIDPNREVVELEIPGATPADGTIRMWVDYWGAAKVIEANGAGVEERVAPDNACPGCFEDRTEHLVWTDDGCRVRCLTCGLWYTPGETGDEERVEPHQACPECGENRQDYLAWSDDGDRVSCATCGTWFEL